MLDPSIIETIAKYCDCNPSLGPFDLSTIGLSADSLHPSIVEYFQYVPEYEISVEDYGSERDICRLTGRVSMVDQNLEYPPGHFIIQLGFVSFGTDMTGDALAANPDDGRVYLVSHEVQWDEELSDDDSMVAKNREIIAEESALIADSIQSFLQGWLKQLKTLDAP